jgi:ribonuclease Z
LKFKLTILGSGGAIPTAQKKPTSQFLNIQDRYFLIDCGEGTQMQLRKFKCKFQKIDNIFISHLHGDHYLGLVGLLSSLNLLGRTQKLHLYAPENLKRILDVHEEVNGRKFDFEIIFHPLKFDGLHCIYEDKIVKIYSFPVCHSIPTCGFLFRENERPRKLLKDKIKEFDIPIAELNNIKAGNDFIKNDKIIQNDLLTVSSPPARSYAFCADTVYNNSIVKFISKVDLLYHESTFLTSMLTRAKSTKHSTAKQAGLIAKEAMVGRLLIGHFSARYKEIDLFESEAKEIFKATTAVSDGDEYELILEDVDNGA